MIHPGRSITWQIRIGKDFIQVAAQDISKGEIFLIIKVKVDGHILEIRSIKTKGVHLIDIPTKGLICMSGPPN